MQPLPDQPHTGRKAPGGLLRRRVRMPLGLEPSLLQMGLGAAIVTYALAMPGDLRYKLSALGFAVCHQIGSHSYFIDGHQLPLCARCSGIYLGAAATLGLLVALRGRSSRLPAAGMLAVLVVFFGVMALDGLNSTLMALGAGIWESTNLTRLLTGTLAGVAVSMVLYPMFNLGLWHPGAARGRRVLDRPLELAAYLAAAGVLAALVLYGGGWLFYPLALLSTGSVLVLLTMANTMLILMAARRESQALTLSGALTPLLLGLLFTLVELTLLAWGRASLAPYLANDLGMPLVPGLP